MSGLEVLGAISAVIAIIDGTAKVWSGARKDLNFSETFRTVGDRLPLLQDTLQTCKEHFEPIKATLPANAASSLLKTIQNCELKAKRLKEIFEKTIPDNDDNWYGRYIKIVRRLGKGNRVEELLKSIAEDAQNLTNYHAVKSNSPALHARLEEMIEQIDALEPSIPGDIGDITNYNTGSGPQNINAGTGPQNNITHTGSGAMQNYGSGSTNPTFNFGLPPSASDFTGSYGYSSLRPVSTYVPRPDLERQLEEELTCPTGQDDFNEPRTAVIWGLGGAGKSQLALNYVRKHGHKYGSKFWIEAGSKETIERDFIQVYKLISPASTLSLASVDAEDAITAVKTWFHSQRQRSLWIMDSADTIEDPKAVSYIDLNHYLPEAPVLDVIITTRSSRAQSRSSLKAVNVQELSEDEAVQLFQQHAKLQSLEKDSKPEIRKIVNELGCLALAVVLAGSYVGETPRLSSDITLYLPEYLTDRTRLLNLEPYNHVHQYSRSVLSTWNMSFSAVERQAPLAARLLNVLAFLNLDDISLDLFDFGPDTSGESGNESDTSREETNIQRDPKTSARSWRRIFRRNPEPVSTMVTNIPPTVARRSLTQLMSSEGSNIENYMVESAFSILEAYSLVSWRADQNAYAMHKLVHSWGHDRLDIPQRQQWSLATLRMLVQILTKNKFKPSVTTRVIPHVTACFAAVSRSCGTGDRMAKGDRNVIGRLTECLWDLGQYNFGYDVGKYTEKITVLMKGQKHPETLHCSHRLADLMEMQGNVKEAESAHRSILAARIEVLGRKHPSTLRSGYGISFLLYRQDKLVEAERMVRPLLRLQEEIQGLDHDDTVETRNVLALVLLKRGQFTESKHLFRNLLRFTQKVRGPEHPDTLTVMHNLAEALRDQGEHKQAEELYRETLQLRQKVRGPEHPDTLITMHKLAGILSQRGEYKQAEELYRQTLQLRQKVLGPEHSDALKAAINLGWTSLYQSKYQEAEKIWLDVSEPALRILAPEDHWIRDLKEGLAEVRVRLRAVEQ